MTDLGELNYILGIQLQRDRKLGLIKLFQENYAKNLHKKFDMENCFKMEIPMDRDINKLYLDK